MISKELVKDLKIRTQKVENKHEEIEKDLSEIKSSMLNIKNELVELKDTSKNSNKVLIDIYKELSSYHKSHSRSLWDIIKIIFSATIGSGLTVLIYHLLGKF